MTQLLLYCVMVIVALIFIFVTCINMWCHDLAVIIIWTWMYLYYVLMSLLWLWSSWSILIGFTLLRENGGSHSHHCFGLLVLASPFIVSTHPLPSSFVFKLTDFLTYGMEDLFPPLEPLLDKPPCLYCVWALSWWQKLPLVSWIVCLNHFGRLPWCLALCRTPPGHLRCWLKWKAHVLPVLEMFICAHGKWKC